MRSPLQRFGAVMLVLGLIPGVAVAGTETHTSLKHYSLKIPQHFNAHKHRWHTIDSLADAARKSRRLVGTAASYNLLTSDDVYADILTQEFNYITPENAGKWGPLQPDTPDEWNFAAHDEMVAFAGDNNLAFKGHALVWHSQAPSFINDDLTAEELQGLIDQHIHTTVSRYGRQIRAWDVVNEAMGDDAQYRDSVFYRKLGADYIADAFYAARAADPTARLYYNDYNIAGLNAKSDAVYEMLKALKEADVPVDGIGLQMHLSATNAPGYEELVENMRRFAWLGLRVNISELDVRISDLPWDHQTNLAIQRQVYHRVVSACMAVRRCEGVTTWGISDQYSWINYTFGADAPLAWDEDYGRKPAYYGMLDGFMRIVPDTSDLPNLVDNSNFEGGVGNWSAWAGELQHVRSFGKRGNSVLLLSERSEDWSAAAYDLTARVSAGQSYDISVKARLGWRSPSDTVELNAKIACTEGNAEYINLEVAVAGSMRWEALNGTLMLPQCELAEVALFVGGPQAGVNLLLDEVVVRPQVLVPSAEGYGDNLIANPYFENDASGWFGFGDAVVSSTSEVVKSGAQSGYVSGRADTWQGPATDVTEGLIAGDIYDMFAWVYVEDTSAWVGATVKATCADGDRFLGITGTGVEANSWTLLRGSVQIPDCELSNAVLYLEGPDAGVNFAVDEVYLRRDNAASDALDQADNGNLHPNGGFELGTEGWSSWGGTLGTSSDWVRSGSASGVLAGRTANWQGPVFNLLSVAQPGSEYQISAWGFIQGAAQDTMSITVKTVCEGEPENYQQLDAQLVDSSAWTELSGSIELPDCTLTEASLYFAGPEAGVDVYLDDVLVTTDNPGSGGDNAANLVANSGFEGSLDGWVSWGGNLAVTTDVAYAGDFSAVLSDRVGSWEGPVYSLLAVVQPAGEYLISAYTRISGGESGSEPLSITLKTTCENGSEEYLWGGEITATNTDWTLLSGRITLPDCVLTDASLYFGGAAQAASIYIDEVSVTAQ